MLKIAYEYILFFIIIFFCLNLIKIIVVYLKIQKQQRIANNKNNETFL